MSRVSQLILQLVVVAWKLNRNLLIVQLHSVGQNNAQNSHRYPTVLIVLVLVHTSVCDQKVHYVEKKNILDNKSLTRSV